ncbi:MAG: XrtA/PEP-CTERM system exopolysaccharide export protein [Pseudomonadota bacterium]
MLNHNALKKFSSCFIVLISTALIVTGCSSAKTIYSEQGQGIDSQGQIQKYLIGPGDQLNVFVWGDKELSTQVAVRPDGLISTPLVEDLQASGKTPTELARSLERALSKYIKNPTVTVSISSFFGQYNDQVRVVGQATQPKAIPFREGMTLLDVVIAVGGLTEFAAGNKASIVRKTDGKTEQFRVYLDDLIRDGDIRANAKMLPGDVLIIPESWF